jgi:hypothetical protein
MEEQKNDINYLMNAQRARIYNAEVESVHLRFRDRKLRIDSLLEQEEKEYQNRNLLG